LVVVFQIPGPLQVFTGGRSPVEVETPGTTVREALRALWAIYPGIRDRISTEQEVIREHVNIFVGNENIRHTGGLATTIHDRAEISIVPSISGG
jgi:molybdopterin converting factor small subunit